MNSPHITCDDGIATSLKAFVSGLRAVAAAGSVKEAVRIAGDADTVISIRGHILCRLYVAAQLVRHDDTLAFD